MENSNGKAIGALVIFGLLGAVAGVLYAPGKDKKNRSMLFSAANRKTKDLTERVKHEGLFV